MLMRILFFAALIGGAFFLYRKYLAPQNANPSKAGRTQALMKKCAHCGVHLPEAESVQLEGLHFCSEAHKLEYQKQHSHHE